MSKEAVKKWADKNRGKIREYSIRNREHRYFVKIKRLFNMTKEEYQLMLDSQAGNCKICGTKMDKICLDHAHDSNKVRGLLCDRCNRGLGFFNDNIEGMERALKYIKGELI